MKARKKKDLQLRAAVYLSLSSLILAVALCFSPSCNYAEDYKPMENASSAQDQCEPLAAEKQVESIKIRHEGIEENRSALESCPHSIEDILHGDSTLCLEKELLKTTKE
jgi:hypothetical protein